MKKVMKSVVALCLLVVLALSAFACKKENEVKEETIFEKQIVNTRYYFQQGYPDNWGYEEGNDGFELRELTTKVKSHQGFLCTKVYPQGKDDVLYAIYKYNTNSVMNTLDGFMKGMMDDSSDYYFNDIFFVSEDEGSRGSFAMLSEDAESDYFHRIQWKYANYSFVKDGEDWKGTFYVTPCNNTYFMVLTCEAKADAWNANAGTFKDMLNDFALKELESK